MIKYNPKKLKFLLAEKGINLRTASLAVGRNRNYLSHRALEGEISANVILELNNLYSISPDEYCEDTNQINKTKIDTDFFEKLYETVYNATYTAVKRAWEDD